MKISFNGSEYILLDDLGRNCGWTKNKETAEKIEQETKQYATWKDMPFKLKLKLVMAGFHENNY